MRKILIIIWIGGMTTSCGLVSKYQSAQHQVYAKMLSQTDKEQINQKGETTKHIELGNAADDSLLKGTLRIIKTDNPDIFNFVEIGQWINHGRLGNSGKYHNLEFKDTTVNDSLGNSLSRVAYYKDRNSEYLLGERWTTKQINNPPIRHVEIFKDRVLISEYDLKLVDFGKARSDIQKEKIKFGTRNDYSPGGQPISKTTYDENGNVLSEERYGR